MNYKYLFFIVLIFLAGAFLVGYVIADLSEVQYPIVDLGNCGSEEDCRVYCENVDNIEVCLNFAEKNNLISKEEIEEARKVLPFLKAGTTPGGCKTKEECEVYCDNDANLVVCLEFAKSAGFISQEDYEIAKLTGGKGPGGCKRDECKNFCENPDNFEICLQFVEENGLVGKVISKEEFEMAKKMIPLMKAGKMPGGCKSKESCEAFCNSPDNTPVCVDFAVEAGFMSVEDAEMVKKTGGKSPGNCRSKEACDAYCKNNQDECAQFALQYGLLSPEEAENIKKYGTSGPGGCKSKEECEAYCQDPNNQEECLNYAKERGLVSEEDLEGMKGSGGGPGGCKSEEECRAYCSDSANQEECSSFGGGSPSEGYPTPPAEYEGQIPSEGYPLTESPPPLESSSLPTEPTPTGYIIMRVVR